MGCRTSEEADFPIPVERGAVPPKRPISLSLWNGVPYLRRGRFPCPFRTGRRTSEEADFPVPSRLGARCSEELRLPDPVEASHPLLRGATFAQPRVGTEPLTLRRGCATLPRWNLTPGAPKSAVCPVPVAGSPYPEGRGTGVRGRGLNAVMLRSAEADPHVTEHSLAATAEAFVTAV
jgi:hypothetical protein